MPLREHLRELRRRVIISALAIGAGAVLGWFVYEGLIIELKRPLDEVSAERGVLATLNYGDVASSLNLKIKISAYLGVIVASPVWLYQIWGFIVPGLTKRERRHSVGFILAAVPLFLGGVALGWFILPNAVKLLTEFTPEGATNLIDAQTYLTFATRLLLVFGIAFVMPVFLVALNFVGVLSGAQLGRSWRMAVFFVFLFTAIANPSPDVGSMLAMALPMVGLYALTVGVCVLNDRRRARKRAQDPVYGIDDDEASPLGAPDTEVEHAGAIDRPAPLDPDRD